MPVTKNAQLRYKVLDNCLSNPSRCYTFYDLKECVNNTLGEFGYNGVSDRQIRDDISYMRNHYDAPIKAVPFEGKKCYYRYSSCNFSVFNNQLTAEEVAQLRTVIEMLGRFRDGSKNAWLEEVISKLEYHFDVRGLTDKVVSFDLNDQLKGLEFLDRLIDATIHHHPLRMLYRSFYGNEYDTIIHPYHLKQYNNRWFLIGLEETETGTRLTNKALDRIVKFSPNLSILHKK